MNIVKLSCGVVGMALLAGLAAGCQNTVNAVGNAETSARPNVVADKRFVTDPFLRERLRLISVNMSPAASGNMMVQVKAVNTRTGWISQFWSGLTGENPYPVDYKFIWFDQNGMELASNLSAWRTVTIHPGEAIQFQAVAPTPQCKDFVLYLKESE